jgi:hypothetical protein
VQALFDLPATKAIGTATARQALGSLQAGAPDALAQASAAGSQVFTAGAPEAPNPVFSALADTGWNAFKNLEPLIDSATLADANVTLGQDRGVLTLGVTNAITPGFRAAGGDRALLGDGADALLYSVASAGGVATIEGFTLGQDTLSLALGGLAVSVLELGGDTLVLFAGHGGAMVLRGVTGAVLGTDIIFG